jgi:hypothetical protein
MHQEWTDDMSNDPLNKRPVSDLYPHGTPMSTHCPPALRENLPPPPAAINDLPPPLIEYLHLLHQHIQHLADQVLLLQSTAQLVHPPAPQDSTISVPSPLNHSSSTTSKRAHSRSYSHVVSQSLPPPASLSHQDHPPARDLDRSKRLKQLIRAKPDQKDRLASLLRSPSAPTPSPSTKIRPPVEPMASLTVEVPLSDDAQADPIYSVAAVIEAMADIKILNANIISPNKFEVFLPASSREHLQTILQEKKILRIPAPLTSQDLLRRASSYNRSRTPTMRQATLEGFSTDLQLQVLALAQERVHRLHPSRQSIMLRAIHYDRKALLSKDPKALRPLPLFNI